MSFRRMTRMISFRVSNDEFELLRSKSESQGARSVSDYARLALCGSPSAPDDQIVHQLSDEIQQLRLEINRLTDILEGPRRSFIDPSSIAAKHNGGLGNA